jgi:shikimate kinase
MKTRGTLKIVGTVAMVGTLAALALFNVSMPESTASTFLAAQANDSNGPSLTAAFNDYVAKYHKSYLTADEYKARYTVFKDNYNAVLAHNQRNDTSHKLALNNFADWSQPELNSFLSFNQPADDI